MKAPVPAGLSGGSGFRGIKKPPAVHGPVERQMLYPNELRARVSKTDHIDLPNLSYPISSKTQKLLYFNRTFVVRAEGLEPPR